MEGGEREQQGERERERGQAGAAVLIGLYENT